MNFDLSEEQQLLKDSVDRFVSDNYDLDTRQKLSKNEAGFSDTYWQTMAELGWLGVTVPEAHGGFGGNQADTMVLMEAFGKGLVLEPFFASAVLGTRAIVSGGSEELQSKLLPELLKGASRLSLAYAEEQSRFDLEDVVTRATANEHGYTITGQKSMAAAPIILWSALALMAANATRAALPSFSSMPRARAYLLMRSLPLMDSKQQNFSLITSR